MKTIRKASALIAVSILIGCGLSVTGNTNTLASQIQQTAFNGRIYQSHQGLNNKIYTRSSTDGVNWTVWSEKGGDTPSAPALAVLNGRLYQSHRGMNNKIYTRSSTDGVNWTVWVEKGGDTPSASALAVLNGRLYQSHRGIDNKIYTRSSTDGVNWTVWVERGGLTPSAPALTAFNGRLYQTHQGMDNKIYTRSSTDGANWTAWVYTGGETPTEADDMTGQITLPYNRGQAWYVCQGYNGTISHQKNYAFDLTVAKDFGGNNACWAADGNVNKSAGQAVLTPAAGTVWYVGQDLVCLEIDSRRSLLIGHIDRRVSNGQRVSQDAVLGTVSRAAGVNGGYAHIHIEPRQSARCTPGTSVPFTAANGFQFEGIGDLPGSVTNTHWKRELRRP